MKRKQTNAWPREAMVKAILNRHFERALGLFPDAATNQAQARAEVETYRPYAEADVDAIIAVLDSVVSPVKHPPPAGNLSDYPESEGGNPANWESRS